MNKKYQIFISSTFDDLKEERNQVIKAVLEMGHIPVGMEMFSAADVEQWRIISQQIDESDYYVVIVAHRYGSLVDGISYTEKEFLHAAAQKIPIYGFIIDETVDALAKDSESDSKRKLALAKFKTKVKQKPVSFWKNQDDLHGKVAIALGKAFNTTPRVGYSRVSSEISPEISLELSRLSKENAELRMQLAIATDNKDSDTKAARRSVIEILKSIPRILELRERGKSKWELTAPTNLYEIFMGLGPEMIIEKSVSDSSIFIARMNRPKGKILSDTFPYASNQMKKLLADFSALGLLQPSAKKHPISDKNEYWSLSPEGAEVLKLHRADNLEIETLI